MKKTDLRDAIMRELQQELARQTDAAALARDEAISEESRPENKWDTHSQEAAYLAEGQARIAAEVSANIELYRNLPLPSFAPGDPIATGALIELESAPGRSTWCFLGPRAGGLEISVDGQPVLVLTPQSPLGRQLLGRRAGDTVSVVARGRSVPQRILTVE